MTDALRFDVVGLGQCSFDILGRLADFPEVDQKAELEEMKFEGGGPVATALVALARQGVSVSFTGRVGDDEYGRQIRDGLMSESVAIDQLRIREGATSQVAFIAVDSQGHRNIFWHRGSAGALEPSEVDKEWIARARVLHLDGLQHEASMAAARAARDHGVVTVLDGGTLRERTRELLPLIDHPVVSEKFGGQLVPGGSIEDVLAALLSFGAIAATVTCGVKGSWTREQGRSSFHQAAFEVDVVDTTGCGDVFHGGYIYGLLQGWELPRIARWAAAMAGLKATGLGGRSMIPNKDEISSYIDTKVA